MSSSIMTFRPCKLVLVMSRPGPVPSPPTIFAPLAPRLPPLRPRDLCGIGGRLGCSLPAGCVCCSCAWGSHEAACGRGVRSLDAHRGMLWKSDGSGVGGRLSSNADAPRRCKPLPDSGESGGETSRRLRAELLRAGGARALCTAGRPRSTAFGQRIAEACGASPRKAAIAAKAFGSAAGAASLISGQPTATEQSASRRGTSLGVPPCNV